jgi:hypothetical protein
MGGAVVTRGTSSVHGSRARVQERA